MYVQYKVFFVPWLTFLFYYTSLLCVWNYFDIPIFQKYMFLRKVNWLYNICIQYYHYQVRQINTFKFKLLKSLFSLQEISWPVYIFWLVEAESRETIRTSWLAVSFDWVLQSHVMAIRTSWLAEDGNCRCGWIFVYIYSINNNPTSLSLLLLLLILSGPIHQKKYKRKPLLF